MRRLLFALPLLAFAGIAAWFAVGLTRDPSVLPSALIDRPMPGFVLPALAGTDAPALSDGTIRGRVALVNVFASWCIPCRAEHPTFMRLAREGRQASQQATARKVIANAQPKIVEASGQPCMNPYLRNAAAS